MDHSLFTRGLAAILVSAAGAAAMAQEADEPNNSAVDATLAGPVGFSRATRVLRAADEDWYRFSVVKGGNPVTVEVAFDTAAYNTALSLEVQTLGGSSLTFGTLAGPAGPYRAVTGPLAVGQYLIAVRYVGGADLLDYTVRTYGGNDTDEPNDSEGGATVIGPVGVLRTGRVLNFGDDDWFRFDVSAASGPVSVDVAYDTGAYHPTLSLEVRAAGGSVIATGAAAPGSFRAVTGPLTPGQYFARVRHLGGDAVSDYSVQTYTSLAMSVPSFIESSAGVGIDVALDISGGVRPYTLAVDSRFVAPPGLAFDAVNGKMTGVPAVPGRYEFMVTCRDSGSPASTVNALTTLVVNAQLDVRLGEFTAFALGRPAGRAMPAVGGTAPFSISTMQGGLPSGVTFVPGGLAFGGASDGSVSGPLSIMVTDAVGFSDSVATTCVVCPPLGAFSLADGPSVSGVYFDAVAGSVVTVNVTTAKKQAKRDLRVVLLGVDGATAVPGAALRGGNGSGGLSRFAVPASGRYYLVVASDAGPATGLVASGKIALPKKGSGRIEDFQALDRVDVAIGALEGATVSITAKTQKALDGLEMRVQGLIDPAGVQMSVDPTTVVVKPGSLTLTRTFPMSGTWTVVLVGVRGGPSRLTYSYSIRQPKNGVYSADE